ncbi:MAG: 6-carboxytetrahydropterin synthase [Clostridia bacterium]|nr:6-carboxytetrahydropterin synthase [Clostridia bacterium]
MYSLKTEHSFDSAHFLKGYEGKCSNIHGHRWRVIIEVWREDVDKEGQTRGMIVDFGTLKKQVRAEADYFDHSLIIEKDSLSQKTLEALKEESFKIIEVGFRPTAENFAKYFYDRFEEAGYNVKEAVVYETPNNCASYSEV